MRAGNETLRYVHRVPAVGGLPTSLTSATTKLAQNVLCLEDYLIATATKTTANNFLRKQAYRKPGSLCS